MDKDTTVPTSVTDSTVPATLQSSVGMMETTGQLGFLLCGFWFTNSIAASAQLGLSEVVEEEEEESSNKSGVPLRKVACRVGVGYNHLLRLVRALTTVGIFTLAKEIVDGNAVVVVRSTKMSSLLSKNHPHTMKGLALLNGDDHRQRPWREMAAALQADKVPFEHVFGTDYYHHMANNPKHSHLLNEGMKSSGANAEVCQAIDLSTTTKICDCGGGYGGLAKALVGHFPGLRSCVFDLRHVINMAGVEFGEGENISVINDTLEYRCGSFFDYDEMPKDCDAYIFKRVIHDWSDEEGVKILSNVCKALQNTSAPEKKLYIADRIVAATDSEDVVSTPATVDMLGAWMDVNTMTILKGEERTLENWNVILQQSGFELLEVKETTRFHILIAKPI